MAELLTAAQMRNAEQAGIDSGRVTGLGMMERAGEGVVEAIFEAWPELPGGRPVGASEKRYLGQEEAPRAVILCGPGNNGGDGFVVARLLAGRGWAVEVFFHGDAAGLPPDAKTNYDRWCGIGEVSSLTYRDFKNTGDADLYVDAVFGTGLTRPVEGDLARVLRYLAGDGGDRGFFAPRLVAVDVPSGLDSDSGRVVGAGSQEWAPACPYCALTVTFHAMKPGHLLADGPAFCGKVVVQGIGLAEQLSPRLSLVETPQDLSKGQGQHKYGYGHALVLTGGFGHTGAARMAARAALRVGAGLVTLAVPGSAQMEVAAQITALMMRRVEDGVGLAALLEDGRLNALCLGPGLGVERARDLVPVALGSEGVKPRPVVLDADALTAFAEAPQDLFDKAHEGCVLTPHGGEFARLFPDIAERLAKAATRGPAYSKVDAARDAAARAGCTVLLKGPDTVIAAPDGRCAINAAVYDRAAPWLATAGSGDVLAGLITGLLARRFDPFAAAGTAAWLHVEAARAFGPGLVAEDLPEMIPQVFRTLAL
ncbi:MAG: bifunctional ADP-dependent NAD(P)H-hydrate dehydratase/NAD(P)H-hydrate epimerase [Rhodobacteraceae bacterium]|nr:bifunctional ADP-dependent NAD(P)H-hydrate dehydratase/NAD(P)H-hydrate epimerase [Paracoccaceae bacterium]MAY48295.1 bifunctional ADP-dependent NAD(P)H-hydrate dehydratase/NAD(P)H-hydrate epimerase [Paracoccaceae bacterium]